MSTKHMRKHINPKHHIGANILISYLNLAPFFVSHVLLFSFCFVQRDQFDSLLFLLFFNNILYEGTHQGRSLIKHKKRTKKNVRTHSDFFCIIFTFLSFLLYKRSNFSHKNKKSEGITGLLFSYLHIHTRKTHSSKSFT